MAQNDHHTVSAHTPVTLTQTREIIRKVLSAPITDNELVPCLYGPSGFGKTSIFNQVAEELEFEKTIILRLSEIYPEDLTGPPMPQVQEGIGAYYSTFHPPGMLLEVTKEYRELLRKHHDKLVARGEAEGEYERPGKTLIIFDELPNARPELQASVHSMLEGRTFGAENHTLDDNVYFGATANRLEDGAHVNPLSAPVRARLAPHLEVNTTPEEWADWARANDIHPPIIVFVQKNEELAYTYERKSKAMTFATLRTWAKASEICKLFGDDPILLEPALQGTIGPAAAQEFIAFLDHTRTAPTAADIVQDPDGTSTFDEEPDIALVVVENVVSGMRKNPKHVAPFLRYTKRMHAQYREIVHGNGLNQYGTHSSEEVIREMIASEDFENIVESSASFARIRKEADAAEKSAQQRLSLS